MPHYRSPGFAAVARALACACVLALADVGNAAFALTFTVNTLADTSSGGSAAGSLRDGLNAVNATTDLVNTIAFQPGLAGTILLTAPLPLVLNNVVIDGTGAIVAIDGASTYRIFFVGVDAATALSLQSLFPNSPLGRGNSLAVTLRKLTLQNGHAQGGTGGGGGMGAGGALFVNGAANVLLDSVSFANNRALGGAGGTGLGGGGLGGNGWGGGGGGIYGNAGAGGGGVFGDGSYGGGGYTGTGGGGGANGIAGNRSLAGIGGPGGGSGSNGETGGADGGGGGGDITGGSGGGGFTGANGTSTQSGNGGFGGGGGAPGYNPGDTLIGGGSGGFGGGGGSTGNGTGGKGGFGGGGGGDGQYYIVATGGFGGGGGASSNGGFGGGGGIGPSDYAGYGGFGGGNGNSSYTYPYSGGGGAGFGGAVFIVDGGVLTLHGSAFDGGGSVTPGVASGFLATSGFAAGSGLFLQGTGTLAFAPAAGKTQTIADSITDEVGSGIPNPPSSSDTWALTKSGAGTLVLGGINGYAGGTTVTGGILRVTGDSAASAYTSVSASATLTGDGRVTNLDNFGTLAPGTGANATGVLQVYRSAYMESGSLACFHADTAGNSSRLVVTPFGSNPILNGAALLAGVARIDFNAGPAPGTQYLLVSSAEIIGAFTGYETNVAGLAGQLDYSATQVTFTVTANDTVFGNNFEAPQPSESQCIAAFAN